MQHNKKQKAVAANAAPTLNDLKAAVYDRMSIIERHGLEIKKLQQEIANINDQIIVEMKKAEEAAK